MSRKSIMLQALSALEKNLQLSESEDKIKVFTSVTEEYEILSTGVGARDVSYSTILSVSGKDAQDFLHRISTNSVKNLEINQAVRTIFTNDKGRILERVVLARLQDQIILFGNEGTEELLSFWLNKYIIMDDVKVKSLYGQQFVIEVHSHQAESLMILLFGDAAKKIEENKIYTVLCDSHIVHFLKIHEQNNKYKYILFGEASGVRAICTQLYESKSILDFSFIGEEAYERFRIEEGLVGPKELSNQFNPIEAGLIGEVDFKKGCYIGQEVIARLDTYHKVQKSLVGFVFKERIAFDGVWPVYDAERNEIGVVTSTANSPESSSMIGLGYIRKSKLETEEEETYFVLDGNREVETYLRKIGNL